MLFYLTWLDFAYFRHCFVNITKIILDMCFIFCHGRIRKSVLDCLCLVISFSMLLSILPPFNLMILSTLYD